MPAESKTKKSVEHTSLEKPQKRVVQVVEEQPEQVDLPEEKMIGFDLTSPEEKVEKTEKSSPFETRSRRIYFLGIIISAFILGATSTTLYFRLRVEKTKQEKTTENVELTDNSTTEETSTPSPEATPIDRAEITLEILNGSGVSGLAGDTEKIFEDLGYVVDNIGNTSTTEGNQLYIKKGIDEKTLQNLLDDVKEKLTITKVTGELEDLNTTARIILGSK